MLLHHMCYGNSEARDEIAVYPQVALPLKLEDAEAREGVMLNASESKIESEDEKQ